MRPPLLPAQTQTSGGVSGTYTGSAAAAGPFGDVQVAITVSNGKITNISVPVYPNNDGRSAQIAQYSIPTLKQEALQAQNANISAVSGASYTSGAFVQSLQSALSAAGL